MTELSKLKNRISKIEERNKKVEKDKTYIIHQIFSHGRMEDILWLFRTYTASTLKEVFSSHAYKDYDAARFHFTKNYLLGLKKTQLNEKNYVKNIPRDIR